MIRGNGIRSIRRELERTSPCRRQSCIRKYSLWSSRNAIARSLPVNGARNLGVVYEDGADLCLSVGKGLNNVGRPEETTIGE